MGVDAHVSERTLREIYLRGFEIAVKEGAPTAIMSSYNLINGVHAANSKDLCTRIAREEWGFDGVIMSDWNTTVPEDGSIPWVCVAAGNDIIMPGNPDDDKNIRDAYKEGKLTEKEREMKKNYIRMWDYRIRNTLGNIRVVDFKTSHVRTFFSALSDEGLAHSTIKGLYGLLNPSFELAVEDGIIRKNPVTGTLGDYGAPAKEKEALTLEQQEKLLKFVEQSNVYKPHLPMMQVMFGACLRVSETIGLTWSDVDMKNREIHVGGQLVYYEGDEGYCFHDSETKTDAGIRDIPMTQMVYDAFRKQRELNLMLGLQSNVEIGGRSGFIFNTKHGRPIMPAGVNSFLKNIVNAYNKKESKLAEEEKREPELMPPISSHTLRHTGCTRLGENNVNPKVMQYVMGHSDAQITMNVYNHIAEKSHVENEMSKMNLPETVPAVV